MKPELDEKDLAILTLLQKNCRMTAREIARKSTIQVMILWVFLVSKALIFIMKVEAMAILLNRKYHLLSRLIHKFF